MEWVETTAATVDEARELALDQLGVDSDEAEFETIEEPRSGLFGRTRGAARVRARVVPKAPPAKAERRRRPKKASDTGGDDSAPPATPERSPAPAAPVTSTPTPSNGDRPRRAAPDKETREPMDTQEQMEVLEGFLRELGTTFGLEVTASSTLEDNQLTVDLTGEDLGLLVGPRLATLDAVQEIARNALQRQAAGREYAKIVVDVAGIRARRREALASFVTDACAQVRDDGVEVIFEVMSSVDRKQVHDLIAAEDGVESASEGEDPRRRVVLRAT